MPGDGEVVDPDPLIASPFWRTRQAFLNLCQGNHYQFDQIRRAKYSSMMVLYHMHHPFAPSFVHACNFCSERITRGNRHSCGVCEDFDLCQSCVDEIAAGKRPDHAHQLHAYAVTGLGDEDKQKAIEQDIKKRQRKIEYYGSALEHAANCRGCATPSCRRMRTMIEHQQACTMSEPAPASGSTSGAGSGGSGGGGGGGGSGDGAPSLSDGRVDLRGGSTLQLRRGVGGGEHCSICNRMRLLEELHAKSCRLRDRACRIPHWYVARSATPRLVLPRSAPLRAATTLEGQFLSRRLAGHTGVCPPF